MKNPFEIISPEDLSPEEIKELFVKSYTELNILKNRKHTIIYGSRGNGKSMLLRFLEPRCQVLDKAMTLEEYLNSPGAFLGVYIPLKEGYFNKRDLLSLDISLAQKLSKHLINLHIVSCFIDILKKQLEEILSNDIESKIAKLAIDLLDIRSTHTSSVVNPTFSTLNDIILKEISSVDEFISFSNFPESKVIYKGNLTDYHTFIKPLFEGIKKDVCQLNNMMFYLLFDEGDRLYPFQAAYINTLIANRDHKLISVKLASKISGYDNYYTESDTLIKEIHDFDTIHLDELYTHSKDTYYNKIKDITNQRLALCNFKTNIEAFLPESDSEIKLFEKIKLKTAEEWEHLPPDERTEDKDNFIRKYAMARLFQHLAQKKQSKRYSGFSNIVHFSSGILRNFLHPCYKMYNSALDKKHNFKEKPYIPESIQYDIINEYSDSFFKELDEAMKGLNISRPEDKKKIEEITNLKNIIENLGGIFYQRLTDKDSRDPRIISVALKDRPSQRLEAILNYGVKESFFHKNFTSSKVGGGRFECYIINRALCPRYKLDLSSLRGRIILKSALLEMLIDNPEAVKKILFKKATSNKKTAKLQSELFDTVDVEFEIDE